MPERGSTGVVLIRAPFDHVGAVAGGGAGHGGAVRLLPGRQGRVDAGRPRTGVHVEQCERTLLDGALVVAGAAAASVLLGLLNVPSAALFGGLLAGLVRALAGRRRIAVPKVANTGAQAVIGVSVGALVQLSTLGTIG